MNQHELRLGSIVTWKDQDDENIDILIVSGILSSGDIWVHYNHVDGECEEIDIEIDSIKPIPTTEHWLTRFRFKGTEFLIGKGNFLYSPHNKVLTWFGVALPDFLWDEVHKLQNLHKALTGQELELKPLEK